MRNPDSPRSLRIRLQRSLLPAALVLPMLLIAFALTSCSHGDAKADAESLLSTVPADAPFVAVADMEEILSEDGARGLLEAFPEYKGLVNDDSGLRLTAMTFFLYEGAPYIVAKVDDAEKFRAFVAREKRREWKSDGKLFTLSNFAQQDDRLWICPDSTRTVAAQRFASLPRSEGFVDNKSAETLADCSDDLKWLGDIDALIDIYATGFGQRASTRMMLGMVFDEARYISGSGDFDKNTLKLKSDILTSAMKPAKCHLKFSEIDTDLVASIGGNANIAVALSLPHKLVEQLLKSTASLGGGMPALYADILSPIDGTVAAASPSDKPSADNYRGVIATRGNQAKLLLALQAAGATVESTEQLLRFSRGDYGHGAFALTDIAAKMKDSYIAAVARKSEGAHNYDIVFRVKGHDGSLRFELEISE